MPIKSCYNDTSATVSFPTESDYKRKERDNFEKLERNGRMILNCMLKKQDGRV
jgi:hypothetical protein